LLNPEEQKLCLNNGDVRKSAPPNGFFQWRGTAARRVQLRQESSMMSL
jgi:hypothetical protein